MDLADVDLFHPLRAEQERKWLRHVFMPPAITSALDGSRSYVLYGAPGSGKSALRLYLMQLATERGALVVNWRPARPSDPSRLSLIAMDCLGQVLNALAISVFEFIGKTPNVFDTAPLWVQRVLLWLFKVQIADWDYQISRISDDEDLAGEEVLRKLQREAAPTIYHNDPSAEELLRDVARALNVVDIPQVWLLVDGMESWLTLDEELLATTLRALFSSLSFFEDQRYLWRFMLPATWELPLRTSGALARRRLDVHHLTWDEGRLREIIERRLAMQFDRHPFRLSDLIGSDEFLRWLSLYGGDTPQGWLEMAAPLVEHYRSTALQVPISEAQWKVLRQRSAPRLRIDLVTYSVYIGRALIKTLQEGEIRVLRYLYERPSRSATRRELYFRGYRDLPDEPRTPQDSGWEAESTWGPIMDTVFWRIRRALEPTRGRRPPLYLISNRGKGTVELERVE